MGTFGIGLVNHTVVTGGAEYLDGKETAISAAANHPFSNAENIRAHQGWRPAVNADDPDSSRCLYRLAESRDVGAVVAAGLEKLDGNDAAVRVRLGHPWMEKPAGPLVEGTTTLSITETESWTVVCLFRLEGANLQASTDEIFEVRKHLTTSSTATRLLQLAVGAAGNPLLRFDRFSGGPLNETDFTSGPQIDDGAWHLAEITFDGSGGAPFTATLRIDGSTVGTETVSEALGPETMCLATFGYHHVAMVEYWNAALDADQLAISRYKIKTGSETDLECGLMWQVADKDTDTVTDVTGGHDFTHDVPLIDNAAAVDNGDGTVDIPATAHGFADGASVIMAGTTNYNGTHELLLASTANVITITATFGSETFAGTETITGVWGLAQHPVPAHDPAAAPRHQAWRRRNALRCVAAGAGTVRTTGSDLSTSPLFHVMFTIKMDYIPAGTGLMWFGAALAVGSYDWYLVILSSGKLRFHTNRFHVSNQVVIDSDASICDGLRHRVSLVCGWGGAMSMSIDGVEEAGSPTAPAFTANSASEFRMHHGSVGFEISGPVVVSRRAYSHAEADAIMLGTAPLIPSPSCDPEVYLWYDLETLDGGDTLLNYGSAGSGGAGGSAADGDLVMTSASASIASGVVENPSAGAMVGDLSTDVQQANFPELLSTDIEVTEILFEAWDPAAAEALRMASLYAVKTVRMVSGVASDLQEGTRGPQVDTTAAGALSGGFESTGRRFTWNEPLLGYPESDNILRAERDAARTWVDGTGRDMRPVIYFLRRPDRADWARFTGICVPSEPSTRITPQGGVLDVSKQLVGDEIKYGQTE